ncbi:hypothetical protein LCGC14_2927340, partial [marine sediment metagenome]
PFWFVPNADETERAMLCMRTPEAQGFNKMRDWFPRSGVVNFAEHEPKVT